MNNRDGADLMLATILIPVRNGAKYLSECLDSCTSQVTNYNFEVLVVNDHSTDSSYSIAESYASEFAYIRVVNSPKRGVGSALNFGIQNARGRYILRLDSDDRIVPTRVEQQVSFMEQNTDYVLQGSQISFIGSPRLGLSPNFYPLGNEEILIFMQKGNAFADPSVIFRANAAAAIGPIKNYLNGAEQYDLWLRMTLLGKVANSELLLTEYRIHANQFTSARSSRVYFSTLLVQIRWILGLTQMQTKRNINLTTFSLQKTKVSRIVMFVYILINLKNQSVAVARRGN